MLDGTYHGRHGDTGGNQVISSFVFQLEYLMAVAWLKCIDAKVYPEGLGGPGQPGPEVGEDAVPRGLGSKWLSAHLCQGFNGSVAVIVQRFQHEAVWRSCDSFNPTHG